MVKQLKENFSLTLVEVLVAMLILSSSAAGVVGSFSYGFKFIQRAGKKIEAMNLNRKAIERYRAIWLSNPYDSRLNIQTDTDITSDIAPDYNGDGKPDYDGTILLSIKEWETGSPIKQISVKVDWVEP